MSTTKVRIITRFSNGTVITFYSDDQFYGIGWMTTLYLGFPIEEITEMINCDTWEQAGKNHLALCQIALHHKLFDLK